ncbi:MAG TPA: hypothetical protein VIL04_00355 [Solirubrobacterales bacterium]|jgi:hypothetical protein
MRAREATDARLVALIALGALALHQLRYALAHGPEAGAALAREGHAYLQLVAGPVLTLALAAIVVSVVRRAWSGGPRSAPSAPRTYGWITASLLAVFAVQELAEGALFAGHASGIAALVGGGGWLALPLAAVIGALLTAASLLLSRADEALAELIERVRSPRRAPRATRSTGTERAVRRPGFDLRFGFARRPPPARAHS